MDRDDEALSYAIAAYKVATGDEISVAGALLRGELERRATSLDAALQREAAAMGEAFAQQVAVLEAEMRSRVKEIEKIAAVEKACLELCIAKMDVSPEEAAVYASVLLSWSTSSKKALPERPEKCYSVVDNMVKNSVKHFMSPAKEIPKQLMKMSQKDLKAIAEQVQLQMKQGGIDIPFQEVATVLSNHLKVLAEPKSAMELIKDALKPITTVSSIIKASVTTVNAVKSIPFCNGLPPEPLLNCRHHVPPGWYFA